MIKEAIVSGTGILFKEDTLKSMGFDFKGLAHELDRLGLDVQRFGLDPSLLKSPVSQQEVSTPSTAVTPSPDSTRSLMPLSVFYSHLVATAAAVFDHSKPLEVTVQHAMDFRDAVAAIYDQLVVAKGWWILEYIPMLTTYQNWDGDWIRMRM